MHKARTPRPVQASAAHVASLEEARRRLPGLSARSYRRPRGVPYSTFSRWWAAWCRHDRKALVGRSRRPRRCPTALPGHVLDAIRKAHLKLGLGVMRRHAYLKQACLISCSLSSVYGVLRRAGALVRRPRRPKPHGQRHFKARPGERAQMALLYLPEGRYQLTLMDDCTRFLAATVLSAPTCPAPRASIPSPVGCIRRDNGPQSATGSPRS